MLTTCYFTKHQNRFQKDIECSEFSHAMIKKLMTALAIKINTLAIKIETYMVFCVLLGTAESHKNLS